MLYLVVILVAVIIGIVAGRSNKKRLKTRDVRFHKIWLAVPAFLLPLISGILSFKGIDRIKYFSQAIMGTAIILLLICLWFNRQYVGLWFIGLGSFLNALVMMVNGGMMPVDAGAVQKVGLVEMIDVLKTGADNKHIILGEGTKLGFLADIIPLPGFWGIGMKVISVGDLVVALGLFIFVFEMCYFSQKVEENYK